MRGRPTLLIAPQAVYVGPPAAPASGLVPGPAVPPGGTARDLVATVAGLLEDLAGYLHAADPERYRRRQCHRPQQDQERVRRQLHRYPKLRQRREGRINDDRVTSDARQQITARRTPHDPRNEISQQRRQDQDQDGGYDARDVGYQLPQDRRDLRDAQSVRGHGDGDDEDEPEHQRAQDARRGLVR